MPKLSSANVASIIIACVTGAFGLGIALVNLMPALFNKVSRDEVAKCVVYAYDMHDFVQTFVGQNENIVSFDSRSSQLRLDTIQGEIENVSKVIDGFNKSTEAYVGKDGRYGFVFLNQLAFEKFKGDVVGASSKLDQMSSSMQAAMKDFEKQRFEMRVGSEKVKFLGQRMDEACKDQVR